MADYAKQPRRKYCQFCKDDVEYVDYKDTQMNYVLRWVCFLSTAIKKIRDGLLFLQLEEK